MCLIIASINGRVPEQELLHNAWKDNPDGWGVMTAEGGRVRVQRGLDREGLVRVFDSLRVNPRPYVAHYRWATHGDKNLDNCHPFKIQSNLYMAHNGIIHIDCPNKGRSDTWHFAQMLRDEKWKAHHLHSKNNRDILADAVGPGNKLVFLDNHGTISIVNENAGLWHEPDIWLSNEYSLPSHQYFFARFRSKAPETCDFCNHQSENLVKIYNEYLCQECIRFYEEYAELEVKASTNKKQKTVEARKSA